MNRKKEEEEEESFSLSSTSSKLIRMEINIYHVMYTKSTYQNNMQ